MQKVALIGAGGMGGVHARHYAHIPDAEIVAVCDESAEAAGKFADQYSVPTFEKIGQLLSEVEVDVIDICTPTPTHLEFVKQAAAAGKHVCCEKPLARTVGDAREAVETCAAAGVQLFVGHVVRWFPAFRKLYNLVAANAVGTPVIVRTRRAGRFPGSGKPWFANFKQSGGVAFDLIIHDYDWLRWCFGKVTRVYARGLYTKAPPGMDYALVTLRFASGVIAHVEGSWAQPGGFSTTVEIAGKRGLLTYSSDDSVPLVIHKKSADGTTDSLPVSQSPTAVDPYRSELQHFISCLEEGHKPEVTPEDGLEAVRIADAALRSITSQEPVPLT